MKKTVECCESQTICRTSECENTEVISISSRQKFGNVNFDTTMERFSLQALKGDSLPQQTCPEESNAAFSFEKRLEEMDVKHQSRVLQLDGATDDPSEGGAQVKIKVEFSQNESELNEAENDVSIGNSEYDLSSVKVKEEKVEFHVADLYSCKGCNPTYNSLDSYKMHRETKHGDSSENRSISDYGVFRDDIKLNEPGTSVGPFMDTFLSRKINSTAVVKFLKKHTLTHIDLKKNRCDCRCEMCNSRFTRKGVLKQHVMTRTEKKPFRCDECNKKFLRKSSLKQHVKTHTGEITFKCEICDSRFTRKQELKRHVMTHTGEKPFKCDECDKRFLKKSSLKQHMKTHTGERTFKCGICNSKFTRKAALKQHVITHTGDKPFKCDECDKRFLKKSSLKQHVKTHTGESTFKCEICDSRFTRKRKLKRHVMTHTRDKPFKCDECDKRFLRKSSLKQHMKTHTGERTFKCDECNKRFLKKSSLKQHVKTHMGERTFKCEICNSRFT